jgi:hypothetical protein
MSDFFKIDNAATAEGYIETTTLVHYLSPDRKAVDFPDGSLLEVELPEYERAGLGRALLRVLRYKFTDLNTFAVEGGALCANGSRKIMVYADMNPVWVGNNHTEAQSRAPKELLQRLYGERIPVEYVTLGALRYEQFPDYIQLAAFIQRYHEKASWIEANPIAVMFENIAEGKHG